MKHFLEIILSKYKDPKLAMWMKFAFIVILILNIFAGIFYPVANKGKVLAMFACMALVLGINCGLSLKKGYRWLDIFTFLLLFLPNLYLFRDGNIGYFSLFYLLLFSVGTVFILGIRISLLFLAACLFYLKWQLRGGGLSLISGIYNRNLLLRFPYLYLCIVGIAYIIMFSIQRYWADKEKTRLILEQRIQEERKKHADMSLNVITSMYAALSAKIPEIDQHCRQVAEYSRQLAERMGLTETMCTDAYYAGLLHEVGAVGLPDEVIQKASLTDEQYEVYKTYVSRGCQIIRELQIADEVATAVLYHRENYDGSGYLEGKAGKNIPILSRILAVTDYADRHHRWGETPEQICGKIRSLKGHQFDPEIAEMMCVILEKES